MREVTARTAREWHLLVLILDIAVIFCIILPLYSIDTEKNRLGLSLLEEDTGVPENISKNFCKYLRVSDAPSDVRTASTVAASRKSVKRKADEDLTDDADDHSKAKRAKVDRITASRKKVKEASVL